MDYFVDTADLAAIEHCCTYYPITGVTTNPSIVSKEKTDFWKLLTSIRRIIGPDRILMAQTVQTKAEKIVEEARRINARVGGKFVIKIPIGEEGLKATMQLRTEGIGVLMTAIFTPTQALMAATAGASYVAPYVNRLDSIVGNGTEVVAQIVRQYENYGVDCQVLAASFKNAEQVNRCAAAGCHAVTVAPDVMKALIAHPLTDAALDGFRHDWSGVYGDKSILDFE